MRNQAALAYQKVAKQTVSPRELESSLLSKSASTLQRLKDSQSVPYSEFREALLYNRKLWQVFLNSATEPDCPLPHEIKENVANLGIFVMNETIELLNSPNPQWRKLDTLININRQIAAGLRARQGGDA